MQQAVNQVMDIKLVSPEVSVNKAESTSGGEAFGKIMSEYSESEASQTDAATSQARGESSVEDGKSLPPDDTQASSQDGAQQQSASEQESGDEVVVEDDIDTSEQASEADDWLAMIEKSQNLNTVVNGASGEAKEQVQILQAVVEKSVEIAQVKAASEGEEGKLANGKVDALTLDATNAVKAGVVNNAQKANEVQVTEGEEALILDEASSGETSEGQKVVPVSVQPKMSEGKVDVKATMIEEESAGDKEIAESLSIDEIEAAEASKVAEKVVVDGAQRKPGVEPNASVKGESKLQDKIATAPVTESGEAEVSQQVKTEHTPEFVAQTSEAVQVEVSKLKDKAQARPLIQGESTKVSPDGEQIKAEQDAVGQKAPEVKPEQLVKTTEHLATQAHQQTEAKLASADVGLSRESTDISAKATSGLNAKIEQAQVSASQSNDNLRQEITKKLNITQQDTAIKLAEKVNLMLGNKVQMADIRLDPPELGSMRAQLHIQGDQAQVQFVVQSSQAKDVLEQSMPKLREMLEQQGIQLGEGQVSEQKKGQTGTESGGSGHANGTEMGAEIEGEVISVTQLELEPGRIDFYA